MKIQHNIAALNAYRNYTNNSSAVSKNLEKLSSGYRINRAGDDAAGLAISEKMRAQITSLSTAEDNANNGISLVQTGEGALTEVHDMLNRMVELADQSSNGTYDDSTDRKNLQKEVTQLKSEINRIADSTNFNGIKLLDGSLGTGSTGATATMAAVSAGASAAGISSFNYEVSGADSGITVQWASQTGGTLGNVTGTWSGTTLTLTLDTGAFAGGNSTITQDAVDSAIRNASGTPSSASNIKVSLSGTATVYESTGTAAGTITFSGGDSATTAAAVKATSASVTKTNTDGTSTSVYVTADKAGVDTRTLTILNSGSVGATVNAANGNVTLNLDASKDYSASDINKMLDDAGVTMGISYSGSISAADLYNGGTGNVFTLGAGTAGAGLSSGGGLSLLIGDSADSFNQLTVSIDDMHASALGIDDIDISTQDGAKSAIDKVKSAINSVSGTRGTLGATQNRLEHTINNLSVMNENITDAESSIRDVDVASEMMDYTKNNILVQSAQAMLAQANQLPQGVLQLLQ